MEPEILVDRNCEVGEGPIWHAAEQRLYWVDIVDGRLYRYDPADGSDELLHEQDVIGGVTVQADGSLLLFGAKGSIRRWADGDVETIVESVEGEADSRFNDVIADPEGRVYGGTMPTDDRLGRLYRVDVDGSVTRVAEGFDIPNGMGFTPDLDQLYVTDSNAGEIRAYDYDRETGALSGPDVVVDTGGEAGIPDGMTVDKEGYIWSARWNGGCLVRYAPDGSEVDRVEFPARKVSSVSFGGPDLSTAFVTTANREGRESEGEGAGALFGLQLGVGGREEFVSRVAAE